jgi:2-polyprenyl-6-hydroxyphenyl methylase/3-demethylubiquinone-9 3-methyltransferase
LIELLGRESFDGEKWIDIGCGSGIHAAAAATLGARVLAVDIDPISVETTKMVCERFEVSDRVHTQVSSVFELENFGERFDVVYSWGVLHHTGDMNRAISIAASLVADKPDAELVLALYRKTKVCGFWQWEKRWYTNTRPGAQRLARKIFSALYGLSFVVRGRSFRKFKASYRSRRGMNYYIDIHDWLGGYPYESVQPQDFTSKMNRSGFSVKRKNVRYPGRTPSGIFGSGCDEFVLGRTSSNT